MKTFFSRFHPGSPLLVNALLGALILLEIFSVSQNIGNKEAFVLYDDEVSSLTITELREPTITLEAAMTSSEEELLSESERAEVLWFFVYLGATALLLGNFLAGYKKDEYRFEWLPEIIYAGAFLLLWFLFREGETATWFPLALIKTTTLLFIGSLYFHQRKGQLL